MGNVRLTRGAKVAATASEADGRAGDAGPQAGPRSRAVGWLQRVLAGLAGGWLGRLLVVQVGPSSWLGGLLLFLFLFLFYISFPLFEFQIWFRI